MKSKGMSSTVLEKILVLIVVFIFCVTVAVYYFLSSFAKTQAIKADHAMIAAQSTQKDIDSLEKSYKWLVDNPAIVDKTNKIVAEASLYKYQDQVITDLETYADQAGIQVGGYTFNDAGGTTTPAAGAAPAAATPSSSQPAASSGGATPAASASTQLPSGLTATTVTLNFYGHIPVKNTLLFIRKIEKNVTRMQITAINMTPFEDNRNTVTLSITVSLFINKGKV